MFFRHCAETAHTAELSMVSFAINHLAKIVTTNSQSGVSDAAPETGTQDQIRHGFVYLQSLSSLSAN